MAPPASVPGVIRRRLGPEGPRFDIATFVTALHGEWDCSGPCAFHRPRAHPLAGEPVRVRVDETNPGLLVTERRCPHDPSGNRWHPDPDQALFLTDRYPAAEYAIAMTHSCDSCCLTARNWLIRAGAPVAPKPSGRVWLWTQSSLYEAHLGSNRLRRLMGVRAPTPNFRSDGHWRDFAMLTPPALGAVLEVVWLDGSGTRTSQVIEISAEPP